MAQQEWLFGLHALQAVLEREPERILELLVLKGRNDERLGEIINQARRFGVSVQFCHRKVLDDKVGGSQHQGVVARAKPARALDENDLAAIVERADKPFLLVLDGVTDPHNLGACLRTADAAGVDAVVVPKDKSASLNGTVSKVACGAAETMPFVGEVLGRLRSSVGNQAAVLGFVGAPWTLAAYVVEGKSSKNYAVIKAMAFREPEMLHKLLRGQYPDVLERFTLPKKSYKRCV